MRVLLICLLSFCSVFFSSGQDIFITPGLPLDSFVTHYPGLRQYEEKNRIQVFRDEKLYGLDGSWLYQFEQDSLAWYCYSYFTYKEKDLNITNYKRCREASLQFIRDQKKKSGKPLLYEKHKKSFAKLRAENITVPVIHAVWENSEVNYFITYKYVAPSRGRGAHLSLEMYFYGPEHKLIK